VDWAASSAESDCSSVEIISMPIGALEPMRSRVSTRSTSGKLTCPRQEPSLPSLHQEVLHGGGTREWDIAELHSHDQITWDSGKVIERRAAAKNVVGVDSEPSVGTNGFTNDGHRLADPTDNPWWHELVRHTQSVLGSQVAYTSELTDGGLEVESCTRRAADRHIDVVGSKSLPDSEQLVNGGVIVRVVRGEEGQGLDLEYGNAVLRPDLGHLLRREPTCDARSEVEATQPDAHVSGCRRGAHSRLEAVPGWPAVRSAGKGVEAGDQVVRADRWRHSIASPMTMANVVRTPVRAERHRRWVPPVY
jgi:hypothetical protein